MQRSLNGNSFFCLLEKYSRWMANNKLLYAENRLNIIHESAGLSKCAEQRQLHEYETFSSLLYSHVRFLFGFAFIETAIGALIRRERA